MSDKTEIEWTDATWNPVYGCSKIAAGCKHCYAERVLPRLGLPFNRITLRPDKLNQPLRWTKPRDVFVNSLSDLFHEDVPVDFIDEVVAVMARARQHRFQVLTKRHQRMRRYFSDDRLASRLSDCIDAEWRDGRRGDPIVTLPLRNVVLGYSASAQKDLDAGIVDLLATLAATRMLSLEPLLGSIDLGDALHRTCCRRPDLAPKQGCGGVGCMGTRIDWVIVGGESGPKARPTHPAWVRSLRDQCQAAGVAFFFKQWGNWRPKRQGPPVDCPKDWGVIATDGTFSPGTTPFNGHDDDSSDAEAVMYRLGKKRAGRELDGWTWDEYPAREEG